MCALKLGQRLALMQAADTPVADRFFGRHSHRSENRDLSVRLLQGHSLLLPWSRYVRVWHYKEEPLERLVIVFGGTEIVVLGSYLSPIMAAIEAGCLAWIRELPGDYRSFSKPAETLIEQLEVHEGPTEAEPAPPPDKEATGGPSQSLGLGTKL